jgi:hypothetical protein
MTMKTATNAAMGVILTNFLCGKINLHIAASRKS